MGSQITVSQYNKAGTGAYNTQTGTAASLGFSSFVHFEKYESGGSGATSVSRPAVLVNSTYSQIDVFSRDTNGVLDDDSWSDTPAGYTLRTIAAGIAGNPVALWSTVTIRRSTCFIGTQSGQLGDASWSAVSGKGYQAQTIANGMAGDPVGHRE